MALTIDDLQELMGGGGAWADLTHVAYHPAGYIYQLGRETVMEAGGEL